MRSNKIVCLALVFLLSLSINSCSVNYTNAIETNFSSPYPYASMTVAVEGSNSAVITIRNDANAKIDISYDYSVILNIQENGEWHDVPCIKDSYIEVSFGLPPGTESSYEIALEEWFGPLNSGDYRIIKPTYGLAKTEYILSEFEIL